MEEKIGKRDPNGASYPYSTGMSLSASVIKTFLPRGPLQQNRLSRATTFHCFRCGRGKTSKLVSTYRGNWNHLLCNACYGRVLALYEIKSGTLADEARADELSEFLLQEVDEDAARQAEARVKARDVRNEQLSDRALRFLGTSEIVAERLQQSPDLDWSAAVLGLCKAFEVELIIRVVDPLKSSLTGVDLKADMADGELRGWPTIAPAVWPSLPEIGSLGRFIQTAVSSRRRAAYSPVIQAFLRFAAKQRDGAWLAAPVGLARSALDLTRDFRNPAVHVSDLTRDDYQRCHEAISGADGALWQLLLAT